MKAALPQAAPERAFHSPGYNNSTDSCCCSFFNCCFCCIFSLIFQILCALVVVVGLAVLIFWLLFRPNPVTFHVNDASLTRFDRPFTNGTLYYHLALNMTIRNSNRRIGIYYDQIEVQALYAGQIFGTTSVPGFYLGHKETEYLNPVFDGQSLVVLRGEDWSKFDMERQLENFSINIKLYLEVRLKMLLFTTPKYKPGIDCDLKVPLDSKGGVSGYFESQRCDFVWKR